MKREIDFETQTAICKKCLCQPVCGKFQATGGEVEKCEHLLERVDFREHAKRMVDANRALGVISGIAVASDTTVRKTLCAAVDSLQETLSEVIGCLNF